MNSSSNAFVTVHMPGLKAMVMARARSQGLTVSGLVRRAIARELKLVDASTAPAVSMESRVSAAPSVKLSVRFTRDQAEQLKSGARLAGLSHGAFITGLLAQLPLSSEDAGSRRDRLAALTASCAELSTLSKNVGRLTALLLHGDVEAAQEYRRMLDTLADDVRSHLRLAATVLAELRPARASVVDAGDVTPRR